MIFAAPPERVWKGLVFYEELGGRPPWHLRLLLPVPIGTEGKVSAVGDEATCLYEGGHLLKRITRIEQGDLYEFEVAEQALSVGGGMRLSGGRYTLRVHYPTAKPKSPSRRATSVANGRVGFGGRSRKWSATCSTATSWARCDVRSKPGEGTDVPELMPPYWLIRAAVAAVWFYEGLWCKLLRGEPREFEVVKAVPRFGARFGVPFLLTLGAVEVAIGLWVLSGAAPFLCALAQTVLLVSLNANGWIWSRHIIHDPRGMLVKNFAFLVLAWVAASVPAGAGP